MAKQIWEFQTGTLADETIRGAVIGSDGTYVFAGNTLGDWNGTNAGSYDWGAFKVDVEGDIVWTWQTMAFVSCRLVGVIPWWQDGTEYGDLIQAIAMAEDKSVVVAGYRFEGGFMAIKLDVDGAQKWKWEDGTLGDDVVNALAMMGDGSAILAGATAGDWNGTSQGSVDFAASKLDANGTLLLRWQDGTTAADYIEAAAVGEDDSVVFAGRTEGNWHGLANGSYDFAAIKLDSDLREVWRWQAGTTLHDIMRGVAIGNDGSVFLVGDTTGDWSGVNAGDRDFCASKLDSDGKEVWKWQGGTAETDVFIGIVAGDDGSVVLTGYTLGVWGTESSGDADFAAVKLDENGIEVWRWQNGSTGTDIATGVTSSATDSHILLVGSTTGAWAADTAVGGSDFAAVLFDTNASASAEPLPVPSQTPESTFAPSLAPTHLSGTTQQPLKQSTTMPTQAPNTDVPSQTPTSSPTAMVDESSRAEDSTSTPIITPNTDTPLSRLTPVPTRTNDGSGLDKVMMVAVSFSVILLIGIVAAGWVCRRRARAIRGAAVDFSSRTTGPPVQVATSPVNRLVPNEGSYVSHPYQKRATEKVSRLTVLESMTKVPGVDVSTTANALPQAHDPSDGAGSEIKDDRSHERHSSSSSDQIRGRSKSSPSDDKGRRYPNQSSGESLNVSISGEQHVHGISVAQAVLEAAQELARMSQIPGVAEVAGFVIVLINMVTDSSDIDGMAGSMIKRCRMVMILLQRAASLLNEVGDNTDPAHRLIVEDVRDAVSDLVDIIKAYQSKGRLSQVIMSTLFKRRQDEAEAVIDAAIGRLHLGLQVQIGHEFKKLGQDVRGGLRLLGHGTERSEPGSTAMLMLEARRSRRQRKLDAVEIPNEDVTVTDELLGKGGFGTVFMADYNGWNAAAKVVQVQHDFGRPNTTTGGIPGDMKHLSSKVGCDNRRRKAFWRELQAMIRLRSPHTVSVYGAITSRQNCLILVMELLAGGDLRSLLEDSTEPLDDEHARRIIRDVCSGMAFLHRKTTVHGDLKSPNVLFDGDGRAKIADFGTSKWMHLSNSTGLVTYTTEGSQSVQMSFAWAAPEGTSYASDVYSFGIVVWEVLSRKIPWEDEACHRDIFVRVVFKEDRPEIPLGFPADMARVMNASWSRDPHERPAFRDIMNWQSWE